MKNSESVYFNSDAAVPFLTTRLISLALSSLAYWLLLYCVRVIFHKDIAGPGRLALVIAILGVLEYAATFLRFNAVPLSGYVYIGLRNTLIPLCARLRFFRHEKLSRWSFYALTLGAAIGVFRYAREGWLDSYGQLQLPTDLVSSGLTIALGIAAIYFTILGLVIQRTIEDYSPSLISVTVRNPVYAAFLSFSLFITVLDLLILHQGPTPDLIKASLWGSLYCVIGVPFLLLETYRSLDISVVLRTLARATARQARRRVRKQPDLFTNERASDAAATIPMPTLLRIFRSRWITGRMNPTDSLPLLDVPDNISKEIQERLRPLTSVCMKAIALDRREVVLTCLAAISYVADQYIQARVSYVNQSDDLLLFIRDQIEIIFNSALTSRNEQYTSDLTDCAYRVALSTLKLTRSNFGGYPENPHIGMFSGLLQDFAIKAFPLGHTNAPTKACSLLRDIGLRLLRREAYLPALYAVADKLEVLGRFSSVLEGPWPATLCRDSISGLVSFAHIILGKEIETGHVFSNSVNNVVEKICTVIDSWYEKPHDHLSNQTVIAPLVGGLWSEPTVPRIFAATLRIDLPDPVVAQTLEELKELSQRLSHLAAKAVRKNRTPQYEYFESASEVAYEAIKFAARSSSDRQRLEMANELVDAAVGFGTGLAELHIRTEGYHGFEDLYKLSPIWAFLIHYSETTNNAHLTEKFVESTERLMKTVETLVGAVNVAGQTGHPRGNNYDLTECCKYVKLFGAWLHRKYPRHPCNKRILLFLAKHYTLLIGSGGPAYSSSAMARLGYPIENIGQAWYIFPSEYWDNERMPVTQSLNELDSYKTYDRLVRKIALRLGTYVEIRVRSML